MPDADATGRRRGSPTSAAEENLDLNALGLRLKTAQHLAHMAIDVRLSSCGLSLGHWAVLREVARTPGASGNHLASATFQTRQSLNQAIAKLHERALVERRQTATRRLEHYLTPEGEHILEVCNTRAREATEQGFTNLSVTDRRQLAALLATVIHSFSGVIAH